MERYIVRALRYIRKSLKQGEQFELVIRDRNGNLVKKYKSRPVAGKLERLISAPFVPEGCCHTVTISLIDSERMKRMERYIVRALRYIHKSLKQGEQFELVIRDRNGHLVKKYKSRPVAGRDDC